MTTTVARLARCAYHGRKPGSLASSDCPAKYAGGPCLCEQPSDAKLPFFESQPSAEYDKYYCGCIGWD